MRTWGWRAATGAPMSIRRQVGLDEFRAQRRVEMQDRRLGRPAVAHRAAPAQAERADRAGLGHLVDEFRAGRVVAVLQCLGKDQPERGAASRRRPRLARLRQDRLDALAPLDRRHAGAEARIAHAAALQRRGMAAVLRGETDGFEETQTQRTGLGDTQRLAEALARGDQVGGVPTSIFPLPL
jgi:hypothetical protein